MSVVFRRVVLETVSQHFRAGLRRTGVLATKQLPSNPLRCQQRSLFSSSLPSSSFVVTNPGGVSVRFFGRTVARRVGGGGGPARGQQQQSRRTLTNEAKNKGGGEKPKEGGSGEKPKYGNHPNQTQLQTWTVAKGVKTGMTLSLQLGIAGLVIVCGGLIIKELIPTKMSPNAVFDTAFERLQRESRITNYFGQNMKAYGRDRSRGAAGLGKVEGRRNFVDHVEYDDEQGVHHTRILFNIEGSSRKGVV